MVAETDMKNPGRVRLSFDISAQLRRRVRLAAAREDVTMTEYLTTVVEERLGDPDDGCEACGAFSHPSGECTDFDNRRR